MPRLKGFRFPREIVAYAVRAYHSFALSTADADHRAHKGLNNRIEDSHRPTRRREKIIGRYKSARQSQRFLAAHDQINTTFKPRRYRLSATSYRHAGADAFELWTDDAPEMAA